MPKLSAGLLVYRRTKGTLEVLLVHPGGPLWAKRDDGAWSIPKGEHGPEDDPLEVAFREFREETGLGRPEGGAPVPLGELPQPSGKRVRVWAMPGDADVTRVRSNTFSMEWPPRSGTTRTFPEVDRAEWFDLETARRKIVGGQVGFLRRLSELLGE